MGKAAKGSRKGKKAWRANIAVDDINDYFEKATKDANAGADGLASVPSSQLFQVDTSSNAKEIPIKKKIGKKQERVLRSELIFQRNPFVKPLPLNVIKKSSKSNQKSDMVKKTVCKDAGKEGEGTTMRDLWAEKGETTTKAKKYSLTDFPAVEVEPLGCSFNPPFEAHQDSLAQAVANEMQKIYKKELDPEPVPLVVTGEVLTEEDKFFLDADNDDENAMDEDDNNCDGDLAVYRKSKPKRVTRVELNRRSRHRERLKGVAEAKKKQNLLKEIDSLPDILQEIAKEDEEKQKKKLRREAALQERRKSAPPRLGRQKFEPAPMEVLLSEEITGSIRKLKPCSTLARDRYKSLEKRGLLVPRSKKIRKKK